MAEAPKTPIKSTSTSAKSTPAPAPAPAAQPVQPDYDATDRSGDSTDAGNVATDGDVVSSTAVPGVDVDEQDSAIKERGSWSAEDHVVDEGVFHNPALVGAGTILPGGGYGPPLPDPQVQRKNEDEDYQVK
jgi:hypothetical protein